MTSEQKLYVHAYPPGQVLAKPAGLLTLISDEQATTVTSEFV